MKKFGSKAISLMLALVMVVGIMPAMLSTAVSAEDTASRATVTTGASGIINLFKTDTYYDMGEKIDTPLTYEFELIGCGQIGSSRAGAILGNYSLDKTRCINIEIHEYGKVRFYINLKNGKTVDVKFDNANGADARTSALRHYAITLDPTAHTLSLYVNGVLKQTVTNSSLTASNLPVASDFITPFRIGGDTRSVNTNFFQGGINSIALYSDIRTAEEIALDAKTTKTWDTDDNLIAAYDITKQAANALRDWSGNGHTLTYTNGSGMRIDNFGSYDIEKKLEGNPETVEAWIYLPDYYYGKDGRGGTFFANSGAGATAGIGFEIEYNGHPRYFYTNASGKATYHEFTEVDVRTGSWQHLTIVHDVANSETRCYINGELKQTLAYTTSITSGDKQDPVAAYHAQLNEIAYMLGGDHQSGYPQYFKGFIKELRAYSDVRTAAEIASDYAGTLDTNDANLLLAYQLSQENTYQNINDLSGNGYDVTYNQPLWDYHEEITDYAYSFAVVGDTQLITNYNPGKLKDMYQWIIDNKEEKNIQYVIGLGDITELGEDEGHRNYNYEKATAQWSAALEAISMMDGELPYSLIRGSGHDGVEFFNQYFGTHEGYTSQIDGYYQEGRIENTYHTFKIGNVNYMILCLDFGAQDDVLEWANEVVAAHPAHRVIVTTHAYMKKDGSFLAGGEDYAPSQYYYNENNNDGDDIWNKFVRKHANIFMVMCGHLSATDVMIGKQIGDHGNEVTQLLIDPSMMDSSASPKGMVAMLYFSEDGESVQVEYHSTLTNTWRPNKSFTVSYGSTVAPSYEGLSEKYVIAQNTENGLYTVVENTYFQFLGGSLRYGDAVDGYTNIRFGYQFASTVNLDTTLWSWNYGVEGEGLNSYKVGSNKTVANVTNLVITGVPAEYYSTNLECQLVFEVTIDGVVYKVIDRVRARNILMIAQNMVRNPNETAEARAYAQSIINAIAP